MSNASVEHRNHQRHKAHENVIALSVEDIGRLTDISTGGAAIKFMGKSKLPPKWSLDIMMLEPNYHATIPVKLVWEKAALPSIYFTTFTRCVGVEFDNLTAENKSMVEHLIKLHDELAV